MVLAHFASRHPLGPDAPQMLPRGEGSDLEYGRTASVTEKDGKMSEEKESPERHIVDGSKVN